MGGSFILLSSVIITLILATTEAGQGSVFTEQIHICIWPPRHSLGQKF